MDSVIGPLLIVAGVGLAVTTVVDIARRPSHMSVIDGWGNPSGLRTFFVVVFIAGVLLFALL